MTKRIVITTVVSFLLLLAVVAAGLNAVFTVTAVETTFSVASEEGRREAAALKEKLDGFVGSSTAFLDEEEIAGIVADYPCMKADRIVKRYPSAVEVSVSERKEAFCVLTEHGYAVLSDDGTYLYNKNNLTNRMGGENILLEGFSFPLVQGEAVQGESFATVLTLYRVFSEILSEARANVVSVALRSGRVSDTFFIRMREGITIEIDSPAERMEEKARASLVDPRGYLARSDGERLSGRIAVIAAGENIMVDYDISHN